MRNVAAQPILRTLLEHHATRQPWRGEPAAVDAGVYTSPDHLAAEQATLFRRWPQVVALSPDLPEAGSTLTRDQLAVPVALTRDAGGRVHALANVCAHRAAQVVPDGRDCARRLTCGYHAWSYDLDGTLCAVPDAASFPDVEVPGPGLRPLPVTEAHGLIWVTPDLDGPAPPEPDLGPLADDFDHYRPAEHRHWRSHRFELELNWKLVIDTFLEPYHFASLHRRTVAPLFVPNLGVAERFGPHLREVLPRRSLAELAEQRPEDWDLVTHAIVVNVLFPNTVFVMLLDHLETWRAYPHPTDPGRCTVDLDFYIPDEGPLSESAERHWDRNWQLTIDTVRDEDFAAMARVQRNLAAGVRDHLLVGANEAGLALFHQVLDEVVPFGARRR
jgi:phenylpropionate dioxygenase-like ring-hydroxylating dioxygenase large terminal subunit